MLYTVEKRVFVWSAVSTTYSDHLVSRIPTRYPGKVESNNGDTRNELHILRKSLVGFPLTDAESV